MGWVQRTASDGSTYWALDGVAGGTATPTEHASTHATGGDDPVTPAAIGAAVSSHPHADLAPLASPVFTGTPRVPTAVVSASGTQAASLDFVIALLQSAIGAAPESLNTLQELAAALGDDANFAGAVTTSLAGKVDKVAGKGLSTEDFTTTLLNKLSNIETAIANAVADSQNVVNSTAAITHDGIWAVREAATQEENGFYLRKGALIKKWPSFEGVASYPVDDPDETGYLLAVSAAGAMTKLAQNLLVLNTDLHNRLMAANEPNIFVNSGMAISRENETDPVANVAGASYAVDGWVIGGTAAGVFTASHDLDGTTIKFPGGHHLGITVNSTVSPTGSDLYYLRQNVEGNRCTGLQWGSVAAVPAAVGFDVRLPVAGTFGGSIMNPTATRTYPFSYTIAADEVGKVVRKFAHILKADDVVGGAWPVAKGAVGLFVNFMLGAGPTISNTPGAWYTGNYRGATGATNLLTAGNKLYFGNLDFYADEHGIERAFPVRSIEEYERECDQYVYKISAKSLYSRFGSGPAYLATNVGISIPKPHGMGTITAMASSGTFRLASGSTTIGLSAGLYISQQSSEYVSIDCTVAGGLTIDAMYELASFNDAEAYLIFFARP